MESYFSILNLRVLNFNAFCYTELNCNKTPSQTKKLHYTDFFVDGVDASDTIHFDNKSGFVNQLNRLSTKILDQLLHRLEYFKETGEHFAVKFYFEIDLIE